MKVLGIDRRIDGLAYALAERDRSTCTLIKTGYTSVSETKNLVDMLWEPEMKIAVIPPASSVTRLDEVVGEKYPDSDTRQTMELLAANKVPAQHGKYDLYVARPSHTRIVATAIPHAQLDTIKADIPSLDALYVTADLLEPLGLTCVIEDLGRTLVVYLYAPTALVEHFQTTGSATAQYSAPTYASDIRQLLLKHHYPADVVYYFGQQQSHLDELSNELARSAIRVELLSVFEHVNRPWLFAALAATRAAQELVA